jgi:hypothetical protein
LIVILEAVFAGEFMERLSEIVVFVRWVQKIKRETQASEDEN